MSIKELYNEVRDEQENGVPAWKLHYQLDEARREIDELKNKYIKLENDYLALCRRIVEAGLDNSI